ncbi:hypothetical protein C1H76_4582 [Elsinoe australis]|uniref:Uncharacterized protein n=1 Tax=Elsinoe australis TaxID=40998 RepID=A0A4V6DU74_9PEZI|nr:hypothetical protein C1H76_4582 [Elsinoe australis]
MALCVHSLLSHRAFITTSPHLLKKIIHTTPSAPQVGGNTDHWQPPADRDMSTVDQQTTSKHKIQRDGHDSSERDESSVSKTIRIRDSEATAPTVSKQQVGALQQASKATEDEVRNATTASSILLGSTSDSGSKSGRISKVPPPAPASSDPQQSSQQAPFVLRILGLTTLLLSHIISIAFQCCHLHQPLPLVNVISNAVELLNAAITYLHHWPRLPITAQTSAPIAAALCALIVSIVQLIPRVPQDATWSLSTLALLLRLWAVIQPCKADGGYGVKWGLVWLARFADLGAHCVSVPWLAQNWGMYAALCGAAMQGVGVVAEMSACLLMRWRGVGRGYDEMGHSEKRVSEK